MGRTTTRIASHPLHMTGGIGVVLLLCICILLQMLGVPITLFNVIIASDLITEAGSEDFSLPSMTNERWAFYARHLPTPFLHAVPHPVFVTSVAHLPSVIDSFGSEPRSL